MNVSEQERPLSSWRYKLHEIIFESDTRAGQVFDFVLLASIVLSVVAVMMESVAQMRADYGPLLVVIEWTFTLRRHMRAQAYRRASMCGAAIGHGRPAPELLAATPTQF